MKALTIGLIVAAGVFGALAIALFIAAVWTAGRTGTNFAATGGICVAAALVSAFFAAAISDIYGVFR